MRKKRFLTLLLLTFIIIASVTNTCQIQIHEAKAANTTVKVVSVYNITEPGMTFNVNITVNNVADLVMWIVDLKWNASAFKINTGDHQGIRKVIGVQYVYYNIYEGPFVEDAREDEDALFLANAIDNENGEITHLSGGYATLGSGASGSGLLATISFTCLVVGETTIEIVYSALKNNVGVTISHEAVNGIVTSELPPISPIWMQLWFQATIVIVVIVIIVGVYVIKSKSAKQPAKTEEDS